MRRHGERWALLGLLLLLGAAWGARTFLGSPRWLVVGVFELLLLPAASPPPLPAAPDRIAHGGGRWRGLPYANSIEALDRSYLHGARWFEVDFSRDASGHWWAAHDWQTAHERFGVPLDAGGRGTPADGGREPLADAGRILAWLDAHPDARLISDTKDEDNAGLLDALAAAPAPLRPRIHPQIYRLREYPGAVGRGLGAPIFTTYRSRYPWWVLRRFTRRHPLLAVTVRRDEVPAAIDELRGAVPVLTHTVNDPVEAAKLASAGVAGIYTDDLLP